MPIDPEILATLDEERSAMASSGRSYRSLRLKANESAIGRFLPVQMGPKKMWFARIGRHWVNNRPVLCTRHTSPHFNGNPQIPCGLCDLEMEFSAHPAKAVADAARKMGAYPRILVYLFVFEITDDRGRTIQTPGNELFVPNEYWLARDGWKEVETLWRKTLERNPPYGFLDPVTGCDFNISRDNRSVYRHQREESQPIDPKIDADEMLDIIDQAFKKVKQPDTTPLSLEEMEVLVEKTRESFIFLERGSVSRGSSRGSASRSPVDQDTDAPAEATRSRRGAAPQEEVARSSSRRSEAASVQEATPRRVPPPPDETAIDEVPPHEPPPRSQPSTRPTRSAPPISGVEAELDAQPPADEPPADEPPPLVRSAGGTALPSRRSAPPPPPARGSRVEDDPEALPRERRDAAPPAPTAGAAPATTTAHQAKLTSSMRTSIGRLGGAKL